MLTEDPGVVFFISLLLFAGGSRDTQAGWYIFSNWEQNMNS